MPIRNDPRFLGRAWISPEDPVVAGRHGTWTLGYEVGDYGYDERARLMIGLRFPCDWALPQFDRPGQADYTTVRLEAKSPSVRVNLLNERRGQARPYFRCLTLAVAAGSLYPGDRIFVTLGDTRGGGPGLRAQTFRESEMEWRFFVDPFGTEVYSVLDSSPKQRVVGGGLHRLVVVAPTTVRPGEPFDALVKAEDAWGNPCERFTGRVELAAQGDGLEGLPDGVAFESGDLAVSKLKGLKLEPPGAEARIVARSADRRAESNAIRALRPDERKTWWADLHGQTRATVGTGTIAEYYTFARDAALLDFTSHQGNDFQVTKEEWRRLREETARFGEDGRFVVFVGYEWSGMTPGGGDHNVLFRGDDVALHRSSHAELDDLSDADTDRFPLTELFDAFRGRDDVILIPHIGGRYADVVNFFDERLEPVIEIYSAWGRFEWLIEDAFKARRKVGFVANSDGHKGRPGASHPGAAKFGMYGGLTCVLADELTRKAVFDALKARRCYAVGAGRRIHVDLSANGLPMGAEGMAGDSVTLKGRVVGAGPIARVDLFKGFDIVDTVTPYAPEDFAASNRYRVEWSGSRVRGRDRTTVWDGNLHLSEGKILAAAPYAFTNPEKGVRLETPTEVSWTSVTTGGDNGVDLALQTTPAALLRFRTAVKNVDVRVGDLRDDRPMAFRAGGLDLEVRMRRLPAGGFRRELAFERSLPPPENPWSAYWIRVTQEDGAQAWTSPVYLRPEG